MRRNEKHPQSTAQRAWIWTGRILSGFIVFAFGASGILKLVGGPELEEGMAHLGLPLSLVVPLAILELVCVVIYLIPTTAVLGAMLLTGYLGGAICTHWRVGDPFIAHIVLGVVVWLGIYLREPRLRQLIPLRTSPSERERPAASGGR